jgi:AraC-like DNA-binding protein
MSPKKLSRDEEQRIYAVKSYVINNLHQKFTVRQLARKAALGEQRFRDGFYHLFRMHVGQYIHATRMQTARFLLTHTDKTIKEIASLTGYRNTDNFLRAFKHFFGTTAGVLRK